MNDQNFKPNYIVVDGARLLSALSELINKNKEHICLYKGLAEETLSAFAPYLLTFGKNEVFDSWYLQQSKNESWGIFIKSKLSLDELSTHLRKFLKVKNEEGKQLYFRFYDPRVLPSFLPTCDKKQLIEFFGAIEEFICEQEEENSMITFSQQDGILKKEIIKVDQQEIDGLKPSKEEQVIQNKKIRNWNI